MREEQSDARPGLVKALGGRSHHGPAAPEYELWWEGAAAGEWEGIAVGLDNWLKKKKGNFCICHLHNPLFLPLLQY